MVIEYGYQVEYDQRTDCRDPLPGRLGPKAREKLAARIAEGRAVIEEPLIGWPGVTHRVRYGCGHYHVRIAD